MTVKTYVFAYVRTYVFMYICIYVLCMNISVYACLYICMGVLDSEQIPLNVPLYKLFSRIMKNGVGAT